jgi:hypothetical protein
MDTDSLSEISRALSRAAGRERTLEFLSRALAQASIDLPPGPSWLLLRLGAADTVSVAQVLADTGADEARLRAALKELAARGLARPDGALTAEGHLMRGRLLRARTAGLRELVADWEPDANPELDPLLRRLAEELAAPV